MNLRIFFKMLYLFHIIVISSALINVFLRNTENINTQKLLDLYKYNYENTHTTKIIIAMNRATDNKMDTDYDRKSLIVKKFLQNMHLPYQIFYHKQPMESNNQRTVFFYWLPDKNINVIIFSQNLTDSLNLILLQLENNQFNHRNKILIVLFTNMDNTDTINAGIREFFHHIWQQNVLNICVYYQIKSDAVDSSEIKEFVYSYNPFKPNGDFLIDLSEKNVKEYYPEKTANLYGTPLRVSLFNFVPNAVRRTQYWGGIEAGAMKPLAQYLNTTYKIVGPNDGQLFGFEKIINETFALLTGGATEDLAMKRADVAINSRSLMPTQYSEAIYPFYKDDIVIIVPKASLIPQYLSFLRTFDSKMRLLIVISIFAACSVNKLFKHFNNERDKSFMKAFLDTLITFLGGGVSNIPPNQASRLYYISWSVYCFFIINAFTSTIISIFVVPLYGKDIDSFSALMDSPYYINAIEQRMNATKAFGSSNTTNASSYSKEFLIIRTKFRSVKVKQFYADLESNNINFAYIFVNSKAKHIVNLKRYSNAGRPIYHIVKEIARFATMTVQRGSPFFNTINRFFSLSLQAGLEKHWETLGGYFRPEFPETEEHYQVLGIDKFEFAFIIFIIGITVSICCFFGELIVMKWMKNHLREANTYA